MKHRAFVAALAACLSPCLAVPLFAGTLYGHVRDQNWYAQYQSNPYGVGQYEVAVNANALNSSSTGGACFTNVFGVFQMDNLPAGTYTVASWDVWQRPAYAFNVAVPSSGTTADIDVRIRAAMWGYACFWDYSGYYEYGQGFVATGPISMIYVRCPGHGTYTLTVHDGGPSGAQVGESRTFSGGGDSRPVWGYNEMPTVAGRYYYIRLRSASPSSPGTVMEMSPRADYSDPMPGGCMYVGTGATLTALPDRDLSTVIYCDDDGLLTNMYTRSSGNDFTGSSVGQTFIARGVNLISAAVWTPDSSATYVVRVLRNGPGGQQVGTTKRGKVGQWASPEMIVTWAPGECPLTPGQTYYLEVTKDGGGTFTAYGCGDEYAYGQGFRDGLPQSGDLAGTIMEEQSPGSATKPTVKITNGPSVAEAERGWNSLTIRWTTDVASDSLVEYAANNPPYTGSKSDPALVTSHAVTLTGLEPNTMYHFRVTSARSGYRTNVFRDMVICTKPAPDTNLLTNAGFEDGTGPSPRSPILGWSTSGSDIKASDGSWIRNLPPYTGTWFAECAAVGIGADGYLYQRVPAIAGKKYTFSAFVTTWPRENNTWKYDVWYNAGRLEWVRLGIDPWGGTDPSSSSIIWTPRMYSHLRYTSLAISAVAQVGYVTVYVRMEGQGLQECLFGVDECALTCEGTVTNLGQIKNSTLDGTSVTVGNLIVTATPAGLSNYVYYVEAPDRSSGIRVFSSSSVSEGARVWVSGTMATLSTGERVINNATLTVIASSSVPQPLALNCVDVGGARGGAMLPGVPGSVGPHNTGLLIKIAGKVTQKAGDNSYVFLNDGSMPDPGVKVDTSKLSAGKVPNVGKVVVVTGISTRWTDASTVKPFVRARRDADMSDPLN